MENSNFPFEKFKGDLLRSKNYYMTLKIEINDEDYPNEYLNSMAVALTLLKSIVEKRI